MSSKLFIAALPKAELHLHLEGSVEPATLAELSRRHDTLLPTENNRYNVAGSGDVLSEHDVGLSLLWIFDAVRHFGVEAAEKVFDLAARLNHRNVAGIGLGGIERQGPAEIFKDLYRRAAGKGLRLTIHAGETEGPESVWAA